MGRWVVAGLVCLFVVGTPHVATAQEPWGGADLGVGISASPGVAQPGRPLIYQVRVHNTGPGDAVLPVLTVRIPPDVEIVNVDVAECRKEPGNEVVCSSPKDVIADGSGGVTITGLVRPGARGSLRAVATLASAVTDVNEADNIAETTTKVGQGIDLAVRLTPSPASTQPGHSFTVDAMVRNHGPRAVKDAYVVFEPSRARYLSASGARCRGRRGYLGCALPVIKSGGAGLLRIVLRVSPTADRAVGTDAMVYSRHLGDNRPDNNRARVQVALLRT
jgi:hypothetical protein